MLNNLAYVKKTNFLSSVRDVYENSSYEYLIALRDALNILIASRDGNGENIDRVIENSHGVIRLWIN